MYILECFRTLYVDWLLDGSKTEAEQCIMMAAKIISPVIDMSYTDGYNWCIDQVKSSQYMDLAHSLDIDKAIGFLKQKDFQQVYSLLYYYQCLFQHA